MREANHMTMRLFRRDGGRVAGNRARRRRFTLLEMLVSMAIIAFLMLVLCRFFANVQLAWTASMNTTELYENARVALDVITRDMQAAVARSNDMPGQHITFHQPDSGKLWFIAVGFPPSPAAASSLVEIGYRFSENRFERAFVDDTCDEWNVYGDRDDADDQDGYIRVVEGVVGLEFVCYSRGTTPYTPSQNHELPNMVGVVLTLMDSKSYKLWEQLTPARRTILEKKVARTFRKTIFLGNRSTQS